jgi:renalase
MLDVLVIGAGMTGISCARQLYASGLDVVVLDKGRGIGGRMATRRADINDQTIRFDHGAQYVTARDAGFQQALSEISDSAVLWADAGKPGAYAGVPGISSIPKALAEGLTIHQSERVEKLEPHDGSWLAKTEANSWQAKRVVMTVPFPQVAPIIGEDHPLSAKLTGLEFAPCMTLMAAFKPDAELDKTTRLNEASDLSWIAFNSGKPGREDAVDAWLAQASVEWSAARVNQDKAKSEQEMQVLLCEALSLDPADMLHSAFHGWLYARIVNPLGVPYLVDETQSLYLGGDWCLGARVESAWQSGTAIAQALTA